MQKCCLLYTSQYTKELWIDRREKSKSLAWSSVLLALSNIKKVGEVVERPKALDVYKRQVKNWMAEDEIGEQSYYYWLRSIGSEMW